MSVSQTAQRQLVHYRLPHAVQWRFRHSWACANQRLDFLCLLPQMKVCAVIGIQLLLLALELVALRCIACNTGR